MTNSQEAKQFDVIILGSGIAGSSLATILAKQQARVLMVDKSNHPRFAIGEGMTPLSELLLRILGKQYSVPELEHLSSFNEVCQHLSPSSCGFKRHFGFLYHEKGKEQRIDQRIQLAGANSSHLFRQDSDEYLVKAAINYGVTFRPNTNVINVTIDSQGVEMETEAGDRFTADYIVDGSGYNSILARKFDLRENQTRLKTNSRSLFTHVVGLENTDGCIDSPEGMISWHKGTIHHVFEGGWMWLIPFDNHQESENNICSVGVNLDCRRFPKTEISPEEEFQNLISKYPNVARQFKNAKAIRPWISTNRMQYSSKSCMGDRFFILPHASGFVDPIFSAGLVQTFTTISPLAAQILTAVKRQDFGKEQFAEIEQMQQDIFDYNDRIARCTYISFTSFDLLNAWLRFWVFQELIHVSGVVFSNLKILTGKQPADLSKFTERRYLERLSPQISGWGHEYIDEAAALMEKVEAGLLSSNEAASSLFSLINSIRWPKNLFKLGDSSYRFFDGQSKLFGYHFLRLILWAKTCASKKAKKQFDFKIKDLLEWLPAEAARYGWGVPKNKFSNARSS